MSDCLFCKIIKGDIPAEKIYEDDKVFAFLDINPVNKGHLLVIPKKHTGDLTEMEDEICDVFLIAKLLGQKQLEKLGADGFNILMNTKPAAGQVIHHSHVHVIPRFESDGLKHWPHKSYEEGEAKQVAEKLNFF